MSWPTEELLLEDLAALLSQLEPAIPEGRKLVLAGRAEVAARLATESLKTASFAVFSPLELVKCREALAMAGLVSAVEVLDPASLVLQPSSWALVVVAALHLLSPRIGDRLLEQAKVATQPGGLVVAGAPTTDDGAYAKLQTMARPIDRHTYLWPTNDPARFLVPGELAMAFEGWLVLHSVHHCRPAADGRDAQHAWVAMAARRPLRGMLLA